MSRPNVLLIVADDHASAALGACGARANRAPHLDSLAADGVRLDACFGANTLGAPARASFLTGKYSHATGIEPLADAIDHGAESTRGRWLRAAGYQTAWLGKRRRDHGGRADPQGFDDGNGWPDQGAYFDPVAIEMGALNQPGLRHGFPGGSSLGLAGAPAGRTAFLSVCGTQGSP